ncbi:monovalent cation:proton antiporter-2 (CPA2) family protein [Limnoraphis robusta Tam1]|uniref:monovalent cation:proton antiporter-2 (CPA2) family protein n=1 Tax=Limnoraphis robusta TaxID=1118279 RepID=UPI002B2035BE|nr:monovalent cation:proton antiporter-2 (CPA2) family protein [Limnoraphis robusta]MEA5500137.1 monovalent cation:proton antiporter-2 (CPA2) family protein [Limnoraphis robusta BA-68 BA1]MEA5541105.1 monovalent cation:proton antiporter-2 (CPA2) family protein [Limnoraphis robusta Tam1]
MSLHHILLDLVLLLTITTVSVILFKRVKLGSVVGLLMAGVVLGPSGLAITEDPEGLRQVTELGVVFLLFIIGLEMQPEKLWSLRRDVFGLGSLQLSVTAIAITLYTQFLGYTWNAALILGLGLAMSSTAFVMQLLEERNETSTEFGQTTFAILLLQDIAIVPVLALVPLLSNQPTQTHNIPFWQQGANVFGGLLVVYFLGFYVVPFVLKIVVRQRNREAIAGIVGLTVIGSAWVMDTVGLSMSLGAFFIGMLLSGSHYRHYLEAEIEPFKNLLLSLFFISVGMSINLDAFLQESFQMVGHALALMLVKAIILFGLCLAFRFSRLTALRVATFLPQNGEFGFVLFSAAVATELISDEAFSWLVMIIVISMVTTPILVRFGDTLTQRLSPTAMGEDHLQTSSKRRLRSRKAVLVIGYGRVGQVVCTILERMNIPYLALEKDLDQVAAGRKVGRSVYFGDVNNPRILSAVRVHRARAVVITVGESKITEKLVNLLQSSYPNLPLVVRTRNLEQREKMLAIGVSHVVPEVVESALMMGEKTLEIVGISELESSSLLSLLRKDEYAALHLSKP